MECTELEFTGERVVFDKMKGAAEVRILQKHLERYVWALKFVQGKEVLDAACGTGYGSWLISLVAEMVTGVDQHENTVRYARYFEKLESGCNLIFGVQDIEDMIAIDAYIDTVVSFETIEHLEHPEKFLNAIKGKELIFSIPIDSPSEYHKQVYETEEEIKKFIESFGWTITDEWLQDGKYFVGRAV